MCACTGYIASCGDVMAPSSLKLLLRKMKFAADYGKLRIKQHEAIRLNPDITKSFMNSDGDVIIVVFDNIGYHIKVCVRGVMLRFVSADYIIDHVLYSIFFKRGVNVVITILYTSCTSVYLQQLSATTGFTITTGSAGRLHRGHHMYESLQVPSLQSSWLRFFARMIPKSVGLILGF